MPRSIRNSPAVDEDIYGSSPAPRRALNSSWQQSRQQTAEQSTALSPSPTANSSDKENAPAHRSNKGKTRAVMPTPSSEEDGNTRKRRQTVTESNPRPSQRPRISTEVEEVAEEDAKDYDPDQDPSKVRDTRKAYRELEGDLSANSGDYLKNSDGLVKTINQANQYFKNVKQTAVATIDSRLMATAAELAYRHTCQLSLGDSVQGVDIDEFVSKCITFMKSEDDDIPGAQFSHSQSHGHRRRHTHGDADDEDVDDGDELNWARLGHLACLRYNSRPSVPGFLLGPLSLEKKARKVTQRVARLRPSQYTQTQPVMLKAGELEHDETKALTYLTRMIYSRLIKTRESRMKKLAAAKGQRQNMTHSDEKKLTEMHGLLYPTQSLNLWQFVVNPRSFGQTVENIFYVSFLLRDGKARLEPDDDGQIGLLQVPENSSAQDDNKPKGKNSTKYQGIISIDMQEWKELIDLYNIKESMIAHRDDEENATARSGWV